MKYVHGQKNLMPDLGIATQGPVDAKGEPWDGEGPKYRICRALDTTPKGVGKRKYPSQECNDRSRIWPETEMKKNGFRNGDFKDDSGQWYLNRCKPCHNIRL